MTAPIGYVNGRFVPVAEIAIPLDDAGFVWGATVTDRLRTFNGRLFRLPEHLSRFQQSCDLTRVPHSRPDSELAAASERLVADNWSGQDMAIVWLATPGRDAPTLIAYTQPLDWHRIARVRYSGAHLVPTPFATGIDPRVKHRSRLVWWIATQQVHEQYPDADPLLVDPGSGHVLETPTANLIAVLDGVVTSPPTATVLPGVSLGVVRELCQGLAIPFAERALTVADLHRASETLLTNTSYCVAGVSRIDGRPVPFPGPILQRLLDAWTELVGTNVRPSAES